MVWQKKDISLSIFIGINRYLQCAVKVKKTVYPNAYVISSIVGGKYI